MEDITVLECEKTRKRYEIEEIDGNVYLCDGGETMIISKYTALDIARAILRHFNEQ